MANPGEKHDAYAVLKLRDFRLFISYRFFITIAFQMQGLIVGWQMYELTHDPLALGLIGLAEALPFISVALYSGHVADRYNRQRIITWFSVLFLLGTLLLFAFSYEEVMGFMALGIFPIYFVVALTGLVRAFLYPSTIALMAQLVPRHLYTNSSTWNSTVWHIAAISGPAIGGLIYGFLGVQIAYMMVVLFVIIALGLLLVVKRYRNPEILQVEPIWKRLSSGLRFVFKNQILLGTMSLDMFAVLFGGAVAMLPIFAAEILYVGPQGLGFLRAAPMLGAVIMSFFLAYKPPAARAGRWLIVSVAGFGLSIICFALSKNFYLSLFLLFMSGLFDNVSVIIRATTLQLLTPDEMRGRVASVNSIFIGSSNEIGSFESGLAARIMGLVPSVIFGGSMTLVVVGIIAKKAPLLRKLNLRALK
ncbi:MAG: MFS transporter [Bacteroidetes bacterium]|nr:MAG: MFS transporter [Bacteroidota bacterium]